MIDDWQLHPVRLAIYYLGMRRIPTTTSMLAKAVQPMALLMMAHLPWDIM